jgi:hypothetical protein
MMKLNGNDLQNLDNYMDKKIKALQKSTNKVVKEEKSLLKADKKNDKVVDKAKMKMKGKC